MSQTFHLGLVMQGGSGWTGGAEYVKNLLLATAGAARAEGCPLRVTLLAGERLEPAWRAQFAPHATIWEMPRLPRVIERSLPTRRWFMQRALRRLQLDFLYPLTYENEWTLGLCFPVAPLLGTTRWAGWIPDFQHRHLPQLFAEKDRHQRDAGIAALAAEAPAVVFSSATAAGEYRAFWPEAQAPAFVLRFATVPGGDWFSGDPAAAVRHHGLPDRFFLVSNQFWQHKNHETVFAAAGILAARGVRAPIVCTGQLQDYRSRDHLENLQGQIHRLGLAGQIHLLGLVPRSEQIQLMRRAVAVVQPSLCEGWSTVVEDARLLAKPILLSDLAVHREQEHPQARYFSGSSAPELADLMAEAWATLPAGPDLAAEEQSRRMAQRAQADFGRRFLTFAKGGAAPAIPGAPSLSSASS